jgi:hypothetical protein
MTIAGSEHLIQVAHEDNLDRTSADSRRNDILAVLIALPTYTR